MARRRINHNRTALKRIDVVKRTGAVILDLSALDLAEVPEAVADLSQVEVLMLGGNQLTALPDFVGRLSRLMGLSLANNQLRELPESLGNLEHLRELDVSANRLTALPASVGRLSQLEQLKLADNVLTELPESIGDLSRLRELDLQRNRLRALPASISRLSVLQHLRLQDNHDLGIPPEILGNHRESGDSDAGEMEPAKIIRYYLSIRLQPTRPLNEAKILIVGQGGVGKTSLVKRLVSNDYDPDEKKTEGINIATWEVGRKNAPGPDADPIRLNIWDFGGQEIMHATHQFFLTKRSLYLVVLDARKGENESNIHYWLKVILSYGGDSPILVVTNKSEQHFLDLNENRLRQDYAPNLKGFHRVSCLTGAGLTELRAAIEQEVNSLPHVFNALPLPYFQVKEQLALSARTSNYIAYTEYEQLCATTGLTQQKDQEILIRFLHDLGNVLNFHDPDSPFALRDLNILNPKWVTGGVYKVLNSNVLMQQQGRLDMADLGEVLGDPVTFPPDRHRFIIDMMRKFELCFDFPDSNGQRILIPELLPKNEPDLDWKERDALNLQYQYNVLPGGLICRFIVRMHHNLTGKATYWRSGVVLEIDGNRILVRADAEAKRVYLTVLGPSASRRRALSVVRDAFKSIHSTIPKIKAEEKVALPDNAGVVVGYEHLLELERAGVKTFMPEGASRMYTVRALLDGIEEPKQSASNSNDRTSIPNVTSPWNSGLFFLATFAVILISAAWASSFVPWYALVPVLLFALLAGTMVGALLLRNDGRLKDESFMTLVREFFRRLILLKSTAPGGETKDGSSAPAGDQTHNPE